MSEPIDSGRNSSVLIRDPLFWGALLVAVITLSTVLAPALSPYDPNEQATGSALSDPSLDHFLGTDELGRDIFSRVLYGGRSVLVVASASVLLAAIVGTVGGIAAGYYGGILDTLTSRVIDVMLALPVILLAITIVVVLGPGVWTLVVAIGVSQIPVFMRLTRSLALTLRQEVYVAASEALGARSRYIIRKHIVPNLLPVLLVQLSTTVGLAILAASALNYLGFGVQPPTADWGALVSDYQRFVFARWWLPVIPGAAIALTVLAVNLASDGLNRRLGLRRRG